jgi:CRISPR-associated protein Cmr5
MNVRSHHVAQSAYTCVAARKSFAEKKQYGALAHQLPILILQNGLAQATGFLLAKGKPEHLALLDDLAQVFHDSGEQRKEGQTLHATVIAADALTTMQLTRRALEATGWIKRYVQGVLKVDATGSSDEENAT